MNTRVGFRMKFEKMQYEELEESIKKYSNLFERYEVKVTKSFCKTEYIRNVISLSKKYLKKEFSLHLYKNLLEDEEILQKCKLIFQVLQDMHYEGNLVTHIPASIDFEKDEGILKKISRMIPNKSILLLENIIVEKNEEYLMKIDKVFSNINKNGTDNIKFCLDLGHLFFSFYKKNVLQEDALKELSKCKNILLNTREIHLHDFNATLDHLHLGEGLLNLVGTADFIIKNRFQCPIIIETTIANPNEDGYEQIKIVREMLSHHLKREN